MVVPRTTHIQGSGTIRRGGRGISHASSSVKRGRRRMRRKEGSGAVDDSPLSEEEWFFLLGRRPSFFPLPSWKRAQEALGFCFLLPPLPTTLQKKKQIYSFLSPRQQKTCFRSFSHFLFLPFLFLLGAALPF